MGRSICNGPANAKRVWSGQFYREHGQCSDTRHETLCRGFQPMKRLLAAAFAVLFLSFNINAAPYDEMDYGPFLSHTFVLPNGNTTLRGIAIPFDARIDGDKTEQIPPKGKKGQPTTIDPGKC